MRREGLSTNTRKRVRGVLSVIFSQAERLELIPSNPVKRTTTPARQFGEPTQVREPLTPDEARTLLGSLTDHRLEAIVLIGLLLGLRRGEILGLKWTDLDPETQTLTVRRTLKEGSRYLKDGTGLTAPRFDGPKTRNSARTIPYPSAVAHALERQRSRQATWRLRAGESWQGSDLIFSNQLGGALWPSNVGQQWNRFLKSIGMRHLRLHDLRHSTATLMLETGVPLEAVSQTLGHSSLVITKDIYAGYVPALINKATAQLATELLGPDRERDDLDANVIPLRARADRPRNPRWRGDT
jgi:integrase